MNTEPSPQKEFDRNQIKEKAEELTLHAGLNELYPFPVEKLVKYLGYTFHYFNPEEETRDISGAVDHDQKKILINKNEPLTRQLFTVAHEIGHIILHKDRGNRVDFRSALAITNDSIETEANQFAAELLMPEEEFKTKMKEHKNNVYLISAYFGVSEAAAKVRVSSLSKTKPSFFSKVKNLLSS